jgi:hypothetical protein
MLYIMTETKCFLFDLACSAAPPENLKRKLGSPLNEISVCEQARSLWDVQALCGYLFKNK